MHSENEIIELEGEFKINKKYCFCCNKMIDIYFSLTQDKLLFFSNKEKTKVCISIDRNLVLAINRRMRKEKDKNKLSIYYLKDKNSYFIKELKLKTENRYEMEKWISNLNKKIKPKRIVYENNKNNYLKANDIFHFKNNTNLYVAFCNLEYILLKNKMKILFDIFSNNRSKISNFDFTDEKDLIKV